MIPHWKQKFALLWTGQALSILSSMISQYALIWYLTDLTGSPAVLSLATMAALVPQGILSLFTGTFADRFDRRWIMIISDGAIGLVSLMLAAAAFAAPLPVAPILAVAALRSVGGAFHAPCIQAITPLLAPPDALTRCAGWSQGIQTVSMLLSPALAAVLYARIPLAWILLLDTLGAAFAIAGVQLARLPALRAEAQGRPLRLWQDTREGLAVLRSHRWLWELSLICALFSVAFLPGIRPVSPNEHGVFRRGLRRRRSGGNPVFCRNAGRIGAPGPVGRYRNKIITMTAAVLGLGLTLVLAGLLPPSGFRAFAGLSLLMGLSAPFFNSVFMALIQTKVEPKYLGRVLGLTGAIMTLASPLGLGLTALFADATGVPLWFLLAGAITLTCGGLMLLLPSVRTCGRP